jgi:regulator of CtrA degradation
MVGTRDGEAGVAATSDGPLHFDALQGEVRRLAEAARDYLAAARIDGGGAGVDPVRQLAVTCEATRLVSRLGFCLAWLLARRAVQSGELTGEAAASDPSWRLGGRETCLAERTSDPATTAALPRGLAELLERSGDLYRRVERLDRGLDRA